MVILDVQDIGQPYTSNKSENTPVDNLNSTAQVQNTINLYTFNSRLSKSIGRSEDFGPKIFKSDNQSHRSS